MKTSTLFLLAGAVVAAGLVYAATRPAALAAETCNAALDAIPADIRTLVLEELRAADGSLPATWEALVASIPTLPEAQRTSVCNAAVRLAENLRGRL